MSSQLDRKEIKRPDAFQEKAGDLVEFLNQNSKSVIVIVAALFAIGIGAGLVNNLRNRKAQEADSAFYQAKKALLKGQLEPLEKVMHDYKGTRASFEAGLALGDNAFEKKNSAKAVEYYKQALENAKTRPMKAVAQHSLAYSYEDSKQYDQAIDSLHYIVGSEDKSLKIDALMALARNYDLKGDKVKAIETYNQITKDFPNTSVAKTAETEKNKLR